MSSRLRQPPGKPADVWRQIVSPAASMRLESWCGGGSITQAATDWQRMCWREAGLDVCSTSAKRVLAEMTSMKRNPLFLAARAPCFLSVRELPFASGRALHLGIGMATRKFRFVMQLRCWRDACEKPRDLLDRGALVVNFAATDGQPWRATWKPAKDWLTGINSIRLTLRCSGSVATQKICSAMSSAVIGLAPPYS